MSEKRERTLILLKPDAVQRGLVGKIIQRFEEKLFLKKRDRSNKSETNARNGLYDFMCFLLL